MPPASIRILIAHRDPVVSLGLQIVLSRHTEFTSAICRPKALLRLQSRRGPPPDMVVADYQTGLQLLRPAATERYPVVILTHQKDDAPMSQALRQGVRGYLLLGSPLEELIAGLKTVYDGGTALSPPVARRVAGWTAHQPLTFREVDVLRHMMAGSSNQQIADELTVALGTVKSHVKSIFRKLRARNRTEAVVVAQQTGIIERPLERRSRVIRHSLGAGQS